jgi:hypothetical protein
MVLDITLILVFQFVVTGAILLLLLLHRFWWPAISVPALAVFPVSAKTSSFFRIQRGQFASISQIKIANHNP